MADLGTCLACFPTLQPDMRMVTSGRQAVAEAVARRLITPRGTLIGDPNYGYEVAQWLNSDLGPGDLSNIQSNINAEALKDERVIGCVSTAVLAQNTLTIVLNLETGSGPFVAVLSISQTSQILSLTP